MTRRAPLLRAASRDRGRPGRAGTGTPSPARGGRHGRRRRARPGRRSPRQEARKQEVEEGRLGEHPASRHAEDRHRTDARDPEEAPGVGRHARAQESRPPMRSIAVNTGSSGSSALAPATTTIRAPAAIASSIAWPTAAASASGYARRASGAPNQSSFSRSTASNRARARGVRLPGSDRAHGPGLEGPHDHAAAARRAQTLLDLAHHAPRDHERRDLGARHDLAGIDHLAVEERVDRDALEAVHRGERRGGHPEESAMRRDDRPLAGRGVPDESPLAPATARATRSPAGSSWRSPGSISMRWTSLAEPATSRAAPAASSRSPFRPSSAPAASRTSWASTQPTSRSALASRGTSAWAFTRGSSGSPRPATDACGGPAAPAWRAPAAGRCRRSGTR